MTATPEATSTSGEQRLRSRRNRFWRYCAIAFVVALLSGLVSGYASDLYKEGNLPAWSLILIWTVVVLAFIWFSRDYFRRVDELDLLDNLWASTFAIYGYFIMLGSWLLFHDVGLASEPQQIPIAIATFAILMISYLARKLGLR